MRITPLWYRTRINFQYKQAMFSIDFSLAQIKSLDDLSCFENEYACNVYFCINFEYPVSVDLRVNRISAI